MFEEGWGGVGYLQHNFRRRPVEVDGFLLEAFGFPAREAWIYVPIWATPSASALRSQQAGCCEKAVYNSGDQQGDAIVQATPPSILFRPHNLLH